MCKRTIHHRLAHASSTLTGVLNILRSRPIDLGPALDLLDHVECHLSVAVDHTQHGDVKVAQNAREAHQLVQEALNLLRNGHNRAYDWLDAATAMVQLAKFRTQCALWAAEDSEWLSEVIRGPRAQIVNSDDGGYVLAHERCSVGYGKEGR